MMFQRYTPLLILFLWLSTLFLSRKVIADEPDKCAADEKKDAEMTALLGKNWGYGYADLLADLTVWGQSPYVTIDSLGATVQNRAIWMLTITDTTPPGSTLRKTVSVHARTHPIEVQAFWVTNEIINQLLAEDHFARFMREHCTFYIIPMYNPDGVELGYTRYNANGVDLESNWNANPVEPEVAVLRNHFYQLMTSPAPIEVALNMHSSYQCTRYFVYHDQVGTSYSYTLLEQNFIEGVRSYYPGGIEPWNFFVSWTSGTPLVYPESWFWLNYHEAVMALTYEDMNCTAAGNYDSTAFALLHGIADYLGLVSTITFSQPEAQDVMELHQNFPNPVSLQAANRSTVIQYRLDQPRSIRLVLYDVLGRQVAMLDEGVKSAGEHHLFYNVSGLAEGIYFYRLETGQRVQTRKLIVIR